MKRDVVRSQNFVHAAAEFILQHARAALAYPLINQARHVCFLANANKDRSLLEKVLEGDQLFPATRVAPVNGDLTWILAEA